MIVEEHLRPGFTTPDFNWDWMTLTWPLAWYVTESKPDNNHHLGRNSGPNVGKNTWVCTCMFACIEMSSWLESWPWGLGHINNNCGKVLHDDLACTNMASATWLHTWIPSQFLKSSNRHFCCHPKTAFIDTEIKIRPPGVTGSNAIQLFLLTSPDTQAIFTSVASFNALTKSDTKPRVSRPFPSKSRFPEHTTVTGQYYFRFERNNAMNAMETIDGEPCICIE
jgi:hypothetical protein